MLASYKAFAINCLRRLAIWVIAAAFMLVAPWMQASPQAQQGNAAAAARSVGTVKSINGQTLVLKPDSGPDVNVSLSDGTRILRLAPGQTDLKSATPLAISDLQVGDRMLVRGRAGENDSIAATAIIVMKQADVAQKQQHDREDWQKRGVGGIVSAIDPASGTITVSVTPTVSIAVKTSKDTSFLRYAPDSIKFADAKKSTLDEIKTGDQLRARGNRSADGKEIAAEEVISGSFRNIAGTITSIDAANNAITVKDILAKKSVVVKFNADSQLRKLAQPMAQRLAFFLKARTESSQGGTPGAGQP
ncbi:MAG TPA: DUF5666 domain-containing protein, partial [Candidatus Angelobacter sp.]|nr:DUF5666 domain-containing protein [Candidatus Angelobacter sp.]